jgi:hypothetical protein
MQGAIIDTPALADIAGDDRPEIVVGTNEEYDAADDGGLNAGRFNTASYSAITAAGEVLSPGNGRLYAIRPDGDSAPDGDAYLPGWPAKIGILNTELLPVVGEGISGYPVVAPATCPSGGAGPKIGVLANNGPAYVLNPSGSSCYGKEDDKDIALASDFSAGGQVDRPLIPAVGHPAFGDLGGPGPTFFAPAAGLQRSLDVVLPEYQTAGQDFLAAWSVTGGGQFRPNFPQTVNDLQFLTGPSIADLDGLPGEEVVEGTASKDLAALNAAGAPLSQSWPKLSTDWTVANPTIGSFGTLDTEPGARKVVIGLTRSGYVNAYRTSGPACSPSSWPRFHHDNANSGDIRRDATLPGKPTGLDIAAGRLRFTSPGDDLMCGKARAYQIATSERRIDESNFARVDRLGQAPQPVEPGRTAVYTLPDRIERFVAVRAVDGQGNVGRVTTIAVGAGGGGPGGGGGPQGRICANRKVGTHRSDRMVGTGSGDTLIGRRGRDFLLGRRGADCLRGNGGRDRLSGGRGPDRLLGGIDQDRLFARDGMRDTVNCGRGRRDRAVVDRRDRVRGCERVRRPRRR